MSDGLRGKQLIVDAEEYMALWREAHGEGPVVVDSAWLSDRYGRTQEWWAGEARSGRVRAWQDSPHSPWYFDRASAHAHLLDLLDRNTSGGIGSRGPRLERRAS